MVTYFEDLEVGRVRVSPEMAVDNEEMLAYARLNDPEPFHLDDEAARQTPFGRVIASGGFTISMLYRLIHALRRANDEELAFLGGFDWHVRFPKPAHGDDRLRLRETLLEKRLSAKGGRGIAKYMLEILNQNDEIVLSVESTVLIATRP